MNETLSDYGPDEQSARDAYLKSLGSPPEAERGKVNLGTAELCELAYTMRAQDLGAPLIEASDDSPIIDLSSHP